MKKIIFSLIFLHLNTGFAYFEHSEDSPAEMNSIKFSDYKDFAAKWKLVTVRYREDSKEIRLTYANDIAYKAMSSLKPDYPDGAIFGKMSFTTGDDAVFPSSKMPSGTKRFQLMVKNKKTYKSSNGWGYALFDSLGKTYKEDIKEQTNACISCHQLVEERGHVFSRSFHTNTATPSDPTTEPRQSHLITFKQKRPKEFKGIVSEYLKESSIWIESLEGSLQKSAFSGTLDEVIPLLVDRAKLMSKDSILFINPLNFTIVKILKKNNCLTEQTKSVNIILYYNGGKVRDSVQCM